MRKILALPVAALLMFVLVLSMNLVSEQAWSDAARRVEEEQAIRRVVGLPSIAIGTYYGATRNPLLEVYCTSLYDVPGGYCYILAAIFVDTPLRDPVYSRTIPGFNMTAQRR